MAVSSQRPAVGRAPRADELELLAEARRVSANAYAPYSSHQVGAVAVSADGRRFAGVNVENASYPVGQCAERVALGALVAAGERRVVLVAVATASAGDLLPCGACLQALAELGEPVVVARLRGRPLAFELRELLTVPFHLSATAAAGAAIEPTSVVGGTDPAPQAGVNRERSRP